MLHNREMHLFFVFVSLELLARLRVLVFIQFINQPIYMPRERVGWRRVRAKPQNTIAEVHAALFFQSNEPLPPPCELILKRNEHINYKERNDKCVCSPSKCIFLSRVSSLILELISCWVYLKSIEPGTEIVRRFFRS